MAHNKLQQIRKYLMPYANQPKQGTKAWLRIRGIGGSELNMCLRDEKRLVAQKTGLIRGMGDNILSCNWGSVLESTLRQITSRVFGTPIFEATSIPSREVKGKTYSMDGIGVVRYRCDRWNDKPYDFFMHMTTLFEYKLPWTREPVPGEIYPDYEPQVLSGMSDLGIPEICLYIEGVMRICAFEDLGNNSRVAEWLHQNRSVKSWLHKSGNPYQQRPMSYGFLGLYMTEAVLPDDPDANSIYEWLKHGNMDFGKLDSQNLLNRLFKFIRKEHVRVWDSERVYQPREWSRCEWFANQQIPIRGSYVDMDHEAIRFHRWCADHDYMALGVLPYKLLDINVVPIQKEEGYTRRYEPEITAALTKIRQLNAIDDIGDRLIAYNRIYGIEDEPVDVDDLDALL